MTRDENEAQKVVADFIVNRGVEICHGHLLFALKLAHNLLVLAPEECVPSEAVDGTMLGGGHQPSPRIIRNSRLRPLLEGSNESVLREFLGKTDVADDPRESRDDSSRLDPPDCVDRAMCIGSRHGYR